MAFKSYGPLICLHRTVNNNWNCPLKVLVWCNNCCQGKKRLANYSNNNVTGNSSTHQVEESKICSTADVTNSNVDLGVPEEPTTCCMSGCANCVWIEYAEELSKRFKDGGEKARAAILKMSDPNMKAFLLTELKSLENK